MYIQRNDNEHNENENEHDHTHYEPKTCTLPQAQKGRNPLSLMPSDPAPRSIPPLKTKIPINKKNI